LSVSRRHIVAGISAAAVLSQLPGAALAQNRAKKFDPAELHKPGPLGDHILGKDDAPVTVVEYASFTCGHCANFIFRVFPTAPAELSIAAGMLAHCAGKDKYFAMTSALFETQRNWASTSDPIPVLLKLANQAGITEEKFRECLSDNKLAQEIQLVAVRGFDTFGVDATPTLFVNGTTKIDGDTSIDALSKIIDPLLK
jgi:protein-disulfide isomerase